MRPYESNNCNSNSMSPRQCRSPSVVSPGTTNKNKHKPTSRIPSTLQAVFLASNRGREVHKPPPEKVAYKEYFRNLWGSVSTSRNGSQSNSRFGSKRNSVAPSARASAKATPVVSPTSGRKVLQKDSLLSDLGLPDAPLATPVKVHKKKKARLPTLSPQQYLDAQCRTRGYSTERFGTLKTGYHNSPTPMQLASYDSYLISLVKQNRVSEIRRIYDSQLISANPCNQYGESLVHTICRLGNTTILKTLVDAGADLQVADDYGRTPLHDACWGAEPSFACIRLILDQNPEAHTRLFFMTDARGAEPLTYVRREHWAAWIEFLESVKNEYWPKVGAAPQAPPPLTQQAANTRLIADPPHPKASTELARLIASGKMTPEEGLLLLTDDDDDDESSSCGSSEDEDSDFSDDDDDDDTDDDDDDLGEVDTAEMKAFLRTVLPAEFTRAH